MRRKLLTTLVLACVTGIGAWAIRRAEHITTPPPSTRLREERVWTVDNQPLDRPVQLLALRAPATAELADGSTSGVHGVRLIAPVDCETLSVLTGTGDGHYVELEILDPRSPASRIDIKGGGGGICGNTRGPIPKYHRQDLATLLVMYGVALPTLGLLDDDPGYARELFGALQRGITNRILREPIKLAGDAEAAQLGRRLMAGDPKLKLAGFWLLAKSRDPQVVASAMARAQDLLAQGVGGNSYEAGQRQLELGIMRGLLYELSRREEVTAPTRKVTDAYGTDSPYQQPGLAVALVSLGDWGLLDELVARLNDPAVPDAYAGPLAIHLADRLDFPLRDGGDRQSFVRWYGAVRPELTWNSRSRFGLGPNTHDRYRASMQGYLRPARQPAAE